MIFLNFLFQINSKLNPFPMRAIIAFIDSNHPKKLLLQLLYRIFWKK